MPDDLSPPAAKAETAEAYVDLTAVPREPAALNVWRAKRFVREVRDYIARDNEPGAAIMSVDLYEAGIVFNVKQADGTASPLTLLDPNLVTAVDPETGLPSAGKVLQTIVQEQGLGMVYDTQDQGKKPRAYPDFKTALERTLMRPEATLLTGIMGNGIVQLAVEKFDHAIPAKAYPAPGMWQ